MEVDQALLKEIKKDLLMQKINNFVHKHKKLVVILLILLIITGIGFFAYNMYIKSLSNSNSTTFNEAKELLEEKKNDEALVLLNQLIKSGTNGYVFLSYMEKAYLHISKNETKEGIAVLQEAYNKITLPVYYKNIIKNIEFIIRMNSNEDTLVLISDIKNALDKKNHLYYHNLEMYYALLIQQKDYQNALIHIEELIASNANMKLVDRAKRIKSLIMGYTN